MRVPHLSAKQRLGLGGAALLAIGVAGGAGAMSLTRPAIEMAPTVTTAVAKLPAASGIVTVRGRVAEVYGDRFIVQDQTGRVLVDAGRGDSAAMTAGSSVMVQGRYDNGQLKARFLVDGSGNVEEVGPPPPHGRGPHPGPDGPPPPPGAGAPPPPPPGAGAPPPPPPGAGVGTDAPPPPPPGAVAPGAAPVAPPAAAAGTVPPPPVVQASPTPVAPRR
ncbi:hypothetical protein [Sphingomonas sp.]|uniref:hypothetical protein n=1 Tax=Sphingomonas sp. TaxID=28214 RepID=UPI0025FA625D|nr:hypothetical protein [Sphingomonas sp.]